METFAGLYARGDFPNALKELEKNRDKISPGLWHFNAGTVKAKMMNPAEARFHFLEAKLHGFTDESLAQNLNLVERELQVSTLEKPLETTDYALRFGLWAQNGFFTTLSLLFLLGGLLILRREKKYYVLILTVLLTLAPLGASYWIKGQDKAVILVAHEVLEGPSAIFASRGELPPGVLVMMKKSGDWLEIVYPSRFRGWIKNTGIKELE